MPQADIRTEWEHAAPGWARWDATIAAWMAPATEAMLAMAGGDLGARVFDLASGTGSQTLQAALEALAQAYPPDQLAARAYALYERFRPAVPEGTKGWGAKGDLRLDAIRGLARKGRG